jgi:hypothetical protein
MKYKLLIGLFCSALVVFGFNLFSSSEPTNQDTIQAKDTKPSNSPISPKEISTPFTEEKIITTSSNTKAQMLAESDSTQVQYKTTDTDISSEDFNRHFIKGDTEQEGVSKSSLVDFFKTDTQIVLEKMQQVEFSQLAQEREIKLSDFMQEQLKEFHFLDKNYKCAARICVLDLKISTSDNNSKLSKLSQFDKNYTFESTQINEFGETIFKALFIATDDPSQLSIVQ